MLKIHEVTRADGTLAPVFLSAAGGTLSITTDDGELPLVDGALEAVMRKLGGPLDPSERVVEVGRLALDGERVLRHVRHRARYDVIARDFLAYVPPGEEALCALAVTVCAALTHLARAGSTASSAR